MVEIDIEPFKEPRGFLKVLQWLFAICAFATTVSFSTTLSFDVHCKDIDPQISVPAPTIKHKVEYPFPDTAAEIQTLIVCNASAPYEMQFMGHARSDAEFFVTTGVLSFLYATALIAVYLLIDKMYTENPRMPKIDLFITFVFALFWLAGSSAWANGLSNLRTGADLESWVPKLSICQPATYGTCDHFVDGAFGGLVISILFGYINFILWTANLWFLYKETAWFDGMKGTNAASAGTSGP